MDNKYTPVCALCGTDDPLFNMWIIVALQQQDSFIKERLCPCCGTHYDKDPRLLQKSPEYIVGKGTPSENSLFFRNC